MLLNVSARLSHVFLAEDVIGFILLCVFCCINTVKKRTNRLTYRILHIEMH